MSETTTLDGRLLCACLVAKDVVVDRLVVDETVNYYRAAGFLERPVAIATGKDDIDACVVGTTSDGVVVAFRGTLPPSLHWSAVADWLLDMDVDPITVDGLPGQVHHGFHIAVSSMWDQLLAEVRRQMEKSGAGLIITGHSKGGAMASIAAMLFHNSGIEPEQVMTLASPNPGDAEFAKAFDVVFTGSKTQRRYQYAGDVVPFVPPTRLMALALIHTPVVGPLFKLLVGDHYAATGVGVFITADGSVISESESKVRYSAAIARDLALLRRNFRKARFPEIIAAHGISCGHGYMRGICGDTVCGVGVPDAGKAALDQLASGPQDP